MSVLSLGDLGTYDDALYPNLWDRCVGAYAPYFGPQGSKLYDFSLQQNHGTISGMVASNNFQSHEGGGYLNFDGVDDLMQAGKIGGLFGQDQCTFSLWFMKFNTTGAAGNVGFGPTTTNNYRVGIFVNGATTYFVVENGAANTYLSGALSIGDWVWNHLAFTYDGNASTKIVGYLNGNVISGMTVTGTLPSTLPAEANANILELGRFQGTWANNWISDGMIHSRVLHPNEIRLLASRRAIAWLPRPRSQVSMSGVFEGSALDAANTGTENLTRWWMHLIHVPWGADQADTAPDPGPPSTQNRWVWADGDTHTWANSEVAGFNEEVVLVTGPSLKYLIEGNSMSTGLHSTIGPLLTTEYGSGYFTVTNFATSGQATETMLADLASGVLPAVTADKTIASIWTIVNDLYLSAISARDAVNNLWSWCDQVKAAGARVIVVTPTPRTNVGTPGDYESRRQTALGLMRAEWAAHAHSMLDIAADSRFTDSTNTTYYADGVHLTTLGYNIVTLGLKKCIDYLVAGGATGAPEFDTQPASGSYVDSGSGVSVPLSAYAVGDSVGGITYQWQRNISGTWTNVSGQTNPTYSPTLAVADTGAQFRCVATGRIGATNSNTATITVSSAPSTWSFRDAVTSDVSGQLVTSIAVSGGTLTWTQSGGQYAALYVASGSDNAMEWEASGGTQWVVFGSGTNGWWGVGDYSSAYKPPTVTGRFNGTTGGVTVGASIAASTFGSPTKFRAGRVGSRIYMEAFVGGVWVPVISGVDLSLLSIPAGFTETSRVGILSGVGVAPAITALRVGTLT